MLAVCLDEKNDGFIYLYDTKIDKVSHHPDDCLEHKRFSALKQNGIRFAEIFGRFNQRRFLSREN